MIKKEKDQYVLYNTAGTKKIFKSTSYTAVVNRQKQNQVFKDIANEKKKQK